MAESSEHIELVAELAKAIGSKWPEATMYCDSKWAECSSRKIKVGRYIPDVTAADSKTGRLFAIGEAKRWDDINTEHTANQLREWLRECEVPICLVMSRGHLEKLQDAVELATGAEQGNRIFVFDGLKWWTRDTDTLAIWRREQ